MDANTTYRLTDGTGTNLVLTTVDLGIPCSLENKRRHHPGPVKIAVRVIPHGEEFTHSVEC